MYHRFIPLLTLIVMAGGFGPRCATDVAKDPPEIRGLWVDAYNDGCKTPAQCDALLAQARALHFNALFVQVRKRGDAYYESSYEPWALDDPDHFDALAYLCRAAHQPGLPRIQIHAWMNACAIGGNADPESVAKLHPDWFSLSDLGADFDGDSTKIDPGNPDAADWTYRVYLDVVRHYDVDGIHLDFIRYGGSGKTEGHWGYNPISVARYNVAHGTTGFPVWNDPAWQQWRRDQVTALVRRIYVNAIAIKPRIVVSAATICWGKPPADDADYEKTSASYASVYAPWRDWLRDGILDLNRPMTYVNEQKHPDWWAGWSTFVKDHQFERDSAMGCAIYQNTPADSLAQMGSTRMAADSGRPAAGSVLFAYAHPSSDLAAPVSFWDGLSQSGLYANDADPPALHWKESADTGAVMGMLLEGPTLTPADSVALQFVSGSSQHTWTAVTDGNGFFAIPRMPPGVYGVFEGGDFGLRRIATCGVGLDEMTRLVVCEDGGPVTGAADLGSARDGASVLVTDAVASSDSDAGGGFSVRDLSGKVVARVVSPGLTPPVVAGDDLVISGVVERSGSGVVIGGARVRQVGAQLVSARK